MHNPPACGEREARAQALQNLGGCRGSPPPHPCPPVPDHFPLLPSPKLPHSSPWVWEPNDNQSYRPSCPAPASSPLGSLRPWGTALPASLRELCEQPDPHHLLPAPEQGLGPQRQSRAADFLSDSSKSGLPVWASVSLLVKWEKSHARATLGHTANQGLSRAGGGDAERPARLERGGPGRPGFAAWTRPCRPGLGKLFR